MKILLISGTHSRHLYLHKKIIDLGLECKAIIMQRESVMQSVNTDSDELENKDKENLKFHFNERFKIETKIFGELDAKKIFSNVPNLFCEKKDLNSKKILDYISSFEADICIVFGSGLLSDKTLKKLPIDTINVHLGLSPFYRGSATLFWPFYNLEPQFVGATFHKVSNVTDGGDILHQTVPKLEYGYGIHDLSAKTVEGAADDLLKLIEIKKNKKWFYHKQKTSGRLYLTKDFKPAHLRVIYDLYNNSIVDEYLNKKLSQHTPKLIKSF
mgnify:FL=1|tara:strand:- start:1441 stop:2250 length:810 start_codon:yes stop_codon:yes gene_type:complete